MLESEGVQAALFPSAGQAGAGGPSGGQAAAGYEVVKLARLCRYAQGHSVPCVRAKRLGSPLTKEDVAAPGPDVDHLTTSAHAPLIRESGLKPERLIEGRAAHGSALVRNRLHIPPFAPWGDRLAVGFGRKETNVALQIDLYRFMASGYFDGELIKTRNGYIVTERAIPPALINAQFTMQNSVMECSL